MATAAQRGPLLIFIPCPSRLLPSIIPASHSHMLRHDQRLLNSNNLHQRKKRAMTMRPSSPAPPKGPAFTRLTMGDMVLMARSHPIPCLFAIGLVLFMGVEYTIPMIPFTSPPLDIGFILTRSLNEFVAARPSLNSLLAALNTVFVVMQTVYILWALLVEGRPRPTIATVFMFTCRGVVGCSTQLPLPKDFLGSGMDFPVGNVSFFLFFSGHVAGAVIAALDMRRMGRRRLARTFDVLNLLQWVRLLATRGHYTIDLAVGVGAGFLFDTFAGMYLSSKNVLGQCQRQERTCCTCTCTCR